MFTITYIFYSEKCYVCSCIPVACDPNMAEWQFCKWIIKLPCQKQRMIKQSKNQTKLWKAGDCKCMQIRIIDRNTADQKLDIKEKLNIP